MKADHLQNLNKLIHEKAKLGIMSALSSAKFLSFTDLKNMLEMTDGNLSVQISKLQKAEYIAVTKQFKKQQTINHLPTDE